MKTTKAFVGYSLLHSALFSLFSITAFAAPITETSLIEIFQIKYPSAYTQYSTNSYFQNTYATGIEAYGDATTGKVGSLSDSSDGFNSIVTIYDTLTFDTTTDVSFSFSVDGVLASNGPFDHPYGQGRIDLYDITGLSTWLEDDDLFGIPQVGISASATAISNNTVSIDMDGISAYQTSTGSTDISNSLTRDGTLHTVNYDLNDTISVDPSKVYGIVLTMNTFSGGTESLANFLNTGTFEFTDLGGATYTSGPGAFLTAVPVPASMWLFGSAVIGLIGIKRKTRNLI